MATVLLGASSTVPPAAGAAGGDTANSNGAGIAFSQRLAAQSNGTVDTLWVKVGASSGAVTLHAAVYSDVAGVCTTRLTSDLTQAAVFSQWNSITGFSLAVTNGTFYWIAWLPVGNVLNYTDNATTGGTEKDMSGQSSLPATYAFTGSNANTANVYATTAGAAAAIATPQRSPLGL